MLYQVETKALNRSVKRNIKRFPGDFCFQLTVEEYEVLRCQIGASKTNADEISDNRGGRRYLPYVDVGTLNLLSRKKKCGGRCIYFETEI